MGIFLIFVSAIFAVTQSVLCKISSSGGRVARAMSFNLFKSLGSFILFALICIWNFKWHMPTVIYGIIYGVGILSCNICGYIALAKGPMALTSLITTYNVVIPCIYGVAFLNEKVGVAQAIGFVLLIISLFFLRKKDKKMVFKKHWVLFTAINFLGNGINSVVLKTHQTMFPGQFRMEFMCISMLVGFVVLLGATIYKKEKPEPSEMKFSVPAGILTGGTTFISLYLSAKVDATVLFPLTTVFSICINCISSKVIFKDRFTVEQIIGIILGVISVILIK